MRAGSIFALLGIFVLASCARDVPLYHYTPSASGQPPAAIQYAQGTNPQHVRAFGIGEPYTRYDEEIRVDRVNHRALTTNAGAADDASEVVRTNRVLLAPGNNIIDLTVWVHTLGLLYFDYTLNAAPGEMYYLRIFAPDPAIHSRQPPIALIMDSKGNILKAVTFREIVRRRASYDPYTKHYTQKEYTYDAVDMTIEQLRASPMVQREVFGRP